MRIRLGRGRAVQEDDNSSPIYHLPAVSPAEGSDRGSSGEVSANPILPSDGLASFVPDANDAAVEMKFELPSLESPPPMIFHNQDFSYPPAPTPMRPISGHNNISEMWTMSSLERVDQVAAKVTKL